jgi:hypothetical protein
MELKKLKYTDENGVERINVSRKMEFFIHYWKFIFSGLDFNFDQHYLKSHRTVIQKLRLQVDGNFSHSKKYFTLFLIDEDLFMNDNPVIKSINGTPIKRSINKIKRLHRTANNSWGPSHQQTRKKLSNSISKLENWLLTDYPVILCENLISELGNNVPVEPKSIKRIKELINGLIIELYNKGFNQDFIAKVPDILFDMERFPFTKTSMDFNSKEDFISYKKTEWASLSLKMQIEGIINLINRPEQTRKVFFRIFDINWRHEPLSIFDVEFYNPNKEFHPKCDPNSLFKLFEETFTIGPEEYEKSSRCNAVVEVQGMQKEQIFNLGYEKVRLALAVLNRELNLQGKVYKTNAFMTNLDFKRIGDSTKSLETGFKALDEIKPNQLERIRNIEQLNIDQEEDRILLTFISKVSTVFNNPNAYNVEQVWMTLEATFGTEKEIIKLFKSIIKIYIRYNFTPFARGRLIRMVNPSLSFSNPDFDYEFSESILKKFYLERKDGSYQISRFIKKLPQLRSEVEIVFIQDFLDSILELENNTGVFFQQIDKHVEYFLSELYTHRNLTVHRNMSDDLFLLKQKQFAYYSDILMEIIVFEYLKPNRVRTINSTVKRLIKKANSI